MGPRESSTMEAGDGVLLPSSQLCPVSTGPKCLSITEVYMRFITIKFVWILWPDNNRGVWGIMPEQELWQVEGDMEGSVHGTFLHDLSIAQCMSAYWLTAPNVNQV